MKKPTICLAVIYGNEEKVIKRFIESFAEVADFMIFCRAIGNQEPDQSSQIIKETCDVLDIPFARIQYDNGSDMPHVDNFGAARQRAWDEAGKTKADYLMWADCDDLLQDGTSDVIRAAAEDKYDIFLMPYNVRGASQVVIRERMVRNDGCSRWKYPIHEQMAFNRDVSYRMLADAVFMHSPEGDKKDQSGRNMAILENQVQEVARYYFYLSVEFFGKNNHVMFRKFGNAALHCPGLEDLERYEILLNFAQVSQGSKAKAYASQAFELMPDRREALALLINYAIIDGKHEKAHQLCRLMMGIPKPNKTYWSMNHDWYDWKGVMLWCQCLRLNGKGEEAEKFEASLRGGALPTFSIIHATLNRVKEAVAIRDLWLSRADNPLIVEYVYGLHSFDVASLKYLTGFNHHVTDKKGSGPNWTHAADISTGHIVIQAQDDVIPPMHWDTLLLERLNNQGVSFDEDVFFMAVGDGQRNDELCITSIMSREYLEFKALEGQGNGFGHDGYFSMFWDNENTHRAYRDQKAGDCKVIEAQDLIFYHDHPLFNPAKPMDSTYEIENAPEHYEAGRKLFLDRNPDFKGEKE